MPEGATKPPLWVRAAVWTASRTAALPVGIKAALFVALLLHGCGLWWGMPASDAWDNDGVAPRDFLPGLAQTFTPGEFYTYPPLHLAFLAVLTLPVTIVAVLRAPTLTVAGVLHEIIEPPYMTTMAMTARVVSLVMSLGIVVALAKIAEEIAPRGKERSAAVFTAWFAALGAPFTFYSHTSNLDVPSLFWASFAALSLTRAIVRREPRRLRTFALLAACGVATKDQAYAVFLYGAPAALALWFVLDDWARKSAKTIAREAGLAAAIGAGFLALVDGAIFNPTGFRARVRFLSGSASQDFAQYAKTAAGRWLAFLDTARYFERHYPAFLAGFIALGLVVLLVQVARRNKRDLLIAPEARGLVGALIPLLLVLSFTLGFNLVARRVEERFTLPQMLFASIYGGYGVAVLWTSDWLAKVKPLAWLVRAGLVAALSTALYRCMTIDATLLAEPRYQTEAFLASHVQPGDVVEVHGLNTYLPRFPPQAKVVRVDHRPVDRRGPLPGVEEVRQPLTDIAKRNPRWVVASDCYVWRYLERPDIGFLSSGGRMLPPTQALEAADQDATIFFRQLYGGQNGYHVADDAYVHEGLFPRVFLHASLSCRTVTFERNAPP
ncbi:hypothetical protein AKJ09_10162 [Labilithrix luteola]|uniref:Glycosyltransferase RgtA/B/C/D-like domain-containing protein n=1 Tax=Labilithrix luteola TaxID=1391654 RepID=A0A0K1QCM7_9BACT|nr:glycosyltransferase family 39 protein [Labilithrix luteola]AKV03499.1 hypothetical protein AKJ09_10162 [Labilithrix luteola]